MQTLTWAIPLAIFVVLGLWRLSIAPYLIKIGEKDKELEQKQRRIDGLLEAANASVSIPSKLLTIEAQVEGFGKPSDEGYPPFDDNTILWARIWPHFNGLGVMLVESVTLDILGSSIPALDWEPVKVCSLITEGPPVGFVYFALREDITSGRYTAKILAFAEGKWWPSEPFLIDIPKR